ACVRLAGGAAHRRARAAAGGGRADRAAPRRGAAAASRRRALGARPGAEAGARRAALRPRADADHLDDRGRAAGRAGAAARGHTGAGAVERIGREVKQELSRFGAQGAMPEVVEAWPEAVGPMVAANAWPARLARDGTLHVN